MPLGAESAPRGSSSLLASARAAGRAAEAEGAGATVLVLRPSVRPAAGRRVEAACGALARAAAPALL
jgi:hypothetical protein